MKNLRFQMSSFPSHRSIIEFSVVGSGKRAYFRIGIKNLDTTHETIAGAEENTARLRKYLKKVLERLEGK